MCSYECYNDEYLISNMIVLSEKEREMQIEVN